MNAAVLESGEQGYSRPAMEMPTVTPGTEESTRIGDLRDIAFAATEAALPKVVIDPQIPEPASAALPKPAVEVQAPADQRVIETQIHRIQDASIPKKGFLTRMRDRYLSRKAEREAQGESDTNILFQQNGKKTLITTDIDTNKVSTDYFDPRLLFAAKVQRKETTELSEKRQVTAVIGPHSIQTREVQKTAVEYEDHPNLQSRLQASNSNDLVAFIRHNYHIELEFDGSGPKGLWAKNPFSAAARRFKKLAAQDPQFKACIKELSDRANHVRSVLA